MLEADEGPEGDWTRPGTFTVAPGVHRVPLPLPNDGLRAVNVYVLEGDADGLTLVDAGWALDEARERLAEGLAALGAGLGDVRRVLVTHVHRDHYTLATWLRRDGGTEVALGRGEQPAIDALVQPDRSPLRGQLRHMRLLGATPLAVAVEAAAGQHRGDLEVWERPDRWLGEERLEAGGRQLDVVPTPGHTAGHVVFHDAADGLLFAGDHVLPNITPSIGLEPVPQDDPLGAFLGALARVRRLPDARLLPAHGVTGGSVHARVDALLDHHATRLASTLAALGEGRTTPYEVAAALTWTRHLRSLDELDLFNQMLAVGETAAHLDLLLNRGQVRREEVDGTRHYAAG